ncbi:hypothetical protein C9374_014221 [Naegleria lovaniensis]|uniref:ENTH domain-containing protein n=1 Tax=Naegleria lovaniensis TaxID=51637 RepID=A0AA88G4Y2_NAELO|nr:uncharacterized protein C9374_014221 [Naegleria lovaniensis]KAG2370806.1 hypothetical protein C9374_014221 [Naegleria lovaniensis]
MSNTAQRLKSRGTSFLRQVKDIGNIAVSSFDDIKMSMAKATNQDPVPPKEKHVKKLILATETNRELNMVEFAKAVCRIYRKSSDWLTASKGLQLLHRIVQEGSTEFCDAIVQNDPEKRFNMSKFKDRHTSEAMDQSPLVKQYCRYLEERLILYRIYQLKSLLPDMTLDAYVSSNDMKDGKKSILNNGAAVGCFTLCLDDSFVLYKLLSDCATKILDDFYKIPLSLAKRALEVYQKYCGAMKRLESMFEFSKNVNQIFLKSKPPSLKFKPESVLDPMREYVESQGVQRENSPEIIQKFQQLIFQAFCQRMN